MVPPCTVDVPESRSSAADAGGTTPIWVYILLLVLLVLVLIGAWKRSARKVANTRRILGDLKRHGGSSSTRQSVRVALGGASDAARRPIDQDADLGYLAIEGAEPGCRDADDIETPNHAYADLHDSAAGSDGRVSPAQPSTAQPARVTSGSGFTRGVATITNPVYQGEQGSVRSYSPPDLRHSRASARAHTSKVHSNVGVVAVGVCHDDERGTNAADYAVVDNVVVLAHSLASTEPVYSAAVDSTTDCGQDAYATIHTGEDGESNIPAHAMGTVLLSDPAQQDSRPDSMPITATGNGVHDATSPVAGSGSVVYSDLRPIYGAASLQPLWLASGSSSSASYDRLAAEPRGAAYAVPGVMTTARPRGQAHATTSEKRNDYAVIRDLMAHEKAGLDSSSDPVYAQVGDGACVHAVNDGTTAGTGPEGNGKLSAAAHRPYDTIELQFVPIPPLSSSTAAAADANHEVFDKSPAVAVGTIATPCTPLCMKKNDVAKC